VDIALESAVVRRALERLPEAEREVLDLRFGLDGETPPQTLDEVVKRLGISRNRVRKLEAEGLARLALLREVQALRRFA
jgi:RNA polymerase sigma factor (sigma-70 family)